MRISLLVSSVLALVSCSTGTPVTITASIVNFNEHGQSRAPSLPGVVRAGRWVSGSFVEYPARVTSDGGVELGGIPQGTEYYLQYIPNPHGNSLSSFWLVTDARTVDLSCLRVGRTDITPAGLSEPPWAVALSGLAPWVGDSSTFDELRFASAGANAHDTLWVHPDAGDTNVDQSTFYLPFPFTYESGENRAGLVDASRGDVTYVVQLRTVFGDGARTSVVAAGLSNAVSLTSGPRRLEVPLSRQVTDTLPPQAKYNLAAFDSLAAQVNPAATPLSGELLVDAVPDTFNQAVTNQQVGVDRLVSVPLFRRALIPDGGVVDLAGSYVNPFSSGWRTVTRVRHSYSVPNEGFDHDFFGRQTTVTVNGSWDGGTAEPQVGPPTELKCNGQSATRNLSGVGDSPELSWSPPTLGHADYYQVAVGSPQGGWSFILTRGTSVRTTVARGLAFNFVVTAVNAPNDEVLTTPVLGQGRLPNATADAVSALVTP